MSTLSLQKILIIAGLITVTAGGYWLFQMPPTTSPETDTAIGEKTETEELPSEIQPENTQKPSGESVPQKPQSPPPETKPSSQTPPPVASVPSKGSGRILLAITDDTVPIAEIESIYVSFNSIAARNAAGNWVPISNELRVYDLLKLKRESKLELMFDTTIPDGMYNNLRLTIDSVVIVKNGLPNTAKLPNNILYLPVSLPLRSGQTAAIMIDIMADKSIHTTAKNQLVFAPVLRIDALGEIQTVQKSGSKVEFFGGLPKYAASFGMTETGNMEQNSLGIDSLSRIEIEQNIYVLTQHSIDRTLFTVSPGTAMETAKNNAYLTEISAVYGTILEKKPTWRVAGSINGSKINVFVNGTDGSVIKVE